MNLEEIQPWVAQLLIGDPQLVGVPVLQDDGSYPKTPQREDALNAKGLVLVVWQLECEGTVDVTNSGGLEEMSLAVIIEENTAVNRGRPGGTGIPAMKALRLVRNALWGQFIEPNSRRALRPADPSFKNFGTENGVQRIVAMFTMELPIER